MTRIKQKVASLATAFALVIGVAGSLPESTLKASAGYTESGTTLTLSGTVQTGDFNEYFGDTRIKKIVAQSGTVITNANNLFGYIEGVETIDLSKARFSLPSDLDNSKMASMFKGCKSLKTIILPDMSNVYPSNLNSMFEGCKNLTTITNLDTMNTSKVANMAAMFRDCASLTNLDLSHFTLSGFTTEWSRNEHSIALMFRGCSALKTVDISGFDTSNVIDMSEMFYGCSSLTTIYGPNVFSTASMTNYAADENMFYACNVLKGGSGTTYASAKVVTSSYARVDGYGSKPGYFTAGKGGTTPPVPEETKYGIKVDNTELTSKNISGYAGVLKYDQANKQLTITDSLDGSLENVSVDGLKINITANCTIYGKLTLNKPTTITGSGKKLTVNYTTANSSAIYAAANLTVETDLRVKGTAYGIQGSGTSTKLIIKNATVSISGKTAAVTGINNGFDTTGTRLVSPREYTLSNGKILDNTGKDATNVLFLQNGKYLKGDVNKDGKVDSTDISLVGRYYAEWPGYANNPKYDWTLADLDGKGGVTVYDINYLGRVCADWQGYWEKYIVNGYFD